MVARWPAALQRWLPDTLFGRLALLLIVAVIVSAGLPELLCVGEVAPSTSF